MTPRERQIVMAWAVQAFAANVAEASIEWSNQDHPAASRPFVTLREIGDQMLTGVPEKRRVTIDDVEYQRSRQSWQCTVGVQVSAKVNDLAPANSQTAGAIMAAAIFHLYSEAVGIPMLTGFQCAVVSVDGPIDLSGLVGGSQYETRADATIVFAFVRLFDEALPRTEQVAGTGTISIDESTLSITFDTEA